MSSLDITTVGNHKVRGSNVADTKRLCRLVHIRSGKLEKGANTTYIKFTADTVVFKLLQGRELNEMKVLES
ncbi:hypothetical protein B4123_3340 [Bacillus paralicheniformis]|uniref:Uncharacterized protein n=1 Tax=Bacillus paralicheniformis TaxID=1648923 RepID=A0ABY3FRS7_9BACI|nr:hypothetical protein SC10_B2orf05735 [Bacillus paralicheniformis]ETB70611.1 hypothetical protein A943_16990 [Bacillus sp. CPSM8]MBG9882196.1 hypothetical protein [Bacillus paralicheniformis]OLG04828.1 hypothetical protein B4125_2900 [Bacillus paralicheniformis]OLG10187.1 hypothetical protein B4123_3340 [Bacillus paralicheniformis]